MTRGLLAIFVALVFLGCTAPESARTASPESTLGPPTSATMARRRDELFQSAVYRDKLWTRLQEPAPGEWLHAFPEHGQTYDEYLGRDPLRAGHGRSTIVLKPLTPLGPRAQAALEPIRAYCQAYFGAEALLAEEGRLPDKTYITERDQYDAFAVRDLLAPLRPPDALVLAGVCDRDLCIPNLNFVFGVGDWTRSVGVYSLVRFVEGDPPDPLYLKRSFALLSHEIGHAFGLSHCIYYRCVMNGMNSLDESDAAPLEPCPVCLRKLQFALGFDVKTRWANLAPLLEQHAIADEAAHVRALLADLGRESAPWRAPKGD